MPDGPNYEKLFTDMKCFHGGNPDDVRQIVRWLRFFKEQEGYEMYLAHYLPMLPADKAAEFTEAETPEIKTEIVEPTPVLEPEPVVVELVSTVVADEPEIKPKKRGRPSLK